MEEGESQIHQDVKQENQQYRKRPVEPQGSDDRNAEQGIDAEDDPLALGQRVILPAELHREHRDLAHQQSAEQDAQQGNEHEPRGPGRQEGLHVVRNEVAQ